MKPKYKQLVHLDQSILRPSIFNNLFFKYPQVDILIAEPLVTGTRDFLKQSLSRIGKGL